MINKKMARMELEDRVIRMETELRQHVTREEHILRDLIAMLRENTTKTDEMHEVFTAARGGFRVIQFLGSAAKPIVYIVALLAAVAVYVKTGNWTFHP